jgi:hypothetical protein
MHCITNPSPFASNLAQAQAHGTSFAYYQQHHLYILVVFFTQAIMRSQSHDMQ